MKKRILSVLLVLVLVVGILPIGVSAKDSTANIVRLLNRDEWKEATFTRAGISNEGIINIQRMFVFTKENEQVGNGDASGIAGSDGGWFRQYVSEVNPQDIDRIVLAFTNTNGATTKTVWAVFHTGDFTASDVKGVSGTTYTEITLTSTGKIRPSGHQVNFYAELNDELGTYSLYDTVYVEHGTKIGNQFPADPPTGSYEFLGWQTEKNGGYTVTADTYVTGDMDVYAAKGTAGTGHALEYHVWAYNNNRDNALLIEVADHYNDAHSTNYSEGSFTMEHIAVNGNDGNSTNPYYDQNNWYPFNEDVHKHYYIYNVDCEGTETRWNHRVEVADITGITVYGKLNGQEYTQFIPRAELNVVEAQSNVVVDIYVREKLDGINKELVTTANQAGAPDVEGVTIPGAGETVYIPEDGSVTLLYKITVTGDFGATYEIQDEDAVLVSGYSFAGRIGADGEAAIYVTKTFDADDIVNGTLSNNASVIPTNSTVGADEDAADDDAVVDAEEGEPEKPELNNGSPVTLQVYVDGETVENPLTYISLSGTSDAGDETAFETTITNNVVNIGFKYTENNCVDIQVDVTDDFTYLLQGVQAYRLGANDLQNVTENEGIYTIDNVASYKDPVILYLYTKYSVEYYQDENVLTGDNYQDNSVYIIAEGVKTATSIDQYPTVGGYSIVQWKNSGYQTKITLPDLPSVSADEEITGWYVNGQNGSLYTKGTSVDVKEVIPGNGDRVISFYALTKEVGGTEAPTVDELNNLIDVYVQCETAPSAHDWTFTDLLEGSYSVTGEGNSRTVTIQAAPYVTALTEKRGVEHENSGSDSATVELVYDGGWLLASGSGTVTFQAKCERQPIMLVIYRNGNTEEAYQSVKLDSVPVGSEKDLSALDIADYYTSPYGYAFAGFYNDGGWNQYKAGNPDHTLDLSQPITINGYTNIICMVTDYEKVVVKAVVDGDKENAADIWTGKALHGENTIQFLEDNAEDMELNRTGYKLDKWYNWDWYGHKYAENTAITGWTNAYVTYTSDWQTVQVQVYRNGDTSKVYQTIKLDPVRKGETFDLTQLNIDSYYDSGFDTGFVFEGWYNDGGWNQYTAGNPNNTLGDSITVTGWTNIICMVWDQFPVVYHGNGGLTENGKDTVSSTFRYGSTATIKNNVFTREEYVFEGWALSENGDVVYKGSEEVPFTEATFSDLLTDGRVDLYAVWAEDKLGGGEDGDAPDQIPDYKQVFVKYISADPDMGSVTPTFEKFEVNGTIALTGTATAGTGYAFVSWTAEDEVVSNTAAIGNVLSNPTGGTVYTFTAHFQVAKPAVPTEDVLAAIEKAVLVKDSSASPIDHGNQYFGLIDGCYEAASDVTLGEDGQYTFQVTPIAAKYAEQYDIAKGLTAGTHTSTVSQSKVDPVILLWNPADQTWSLQTAETIGVKCAAPAAPDLTDLLQVAVKDHAGGNVPEGAEDHSNKTFQLLDATYEATEPTVQDKTYVITVQLTDGSAYAAAYDEALTLEAGTHTLTTSVSKLNPITVTYNPADGTWTPSAASWTLGVKCEPVAKKIIVNFNNGDGTWDDEVPDNEAKQFVLSSTTADAELMAPTVAAPEGKVFSHWTNNWDSSTLPAEANFSYNSMADIVGDDEVELYIAWTAVYVDAPVVQRTVEVTFTVNPAYGSFTEYGEGPVTFKNIDEFSTQQFEVPAVTAKEGYKFVGWKGQGADVIEWGADASTFGVPGLCYFAEGSNVGYASIEAVFEEVPEVQRTVEVTFTVNPAYGSFTEYGEGPVTFKNIDEFSTQQFEVPAVTAKEGYKFVGWKGQGADVIEWGADASTFGVPGLCYFAEGSNVGYASIEAVFEKVTPATYTVTLVGEGRNAYGEGTYKAGETVTIYAGTKTGYAFDQWTSSDVKLSKPYNKKITFTMPAHDVAVKANWDRAGSILPSLPDVSDDTTPNWLNLDDHDAYIQGYPDGRVKPQNNITRAEVATIFYRLLTDDARAYFWSDDSGFSDVKPGDWYNTAVSTMVNAGILTGYGDGTFKPNASITRAEFATIAARFLSNAYSLRDRFNDTEGHWAEVYINRAAEIGWITGYSDGSFKPDQAITRAEAVTLVNNVLGRKPHADYMLDDMVTWPDNPKSAWYYEAIQEATNSHDYRWSSKDYEIWTKLR